ncbi:MAG TPA: tRNA (guanosine(37)-N1)-methyltransferase TrmD [Firmicutes bacterium]|nr:tRNA (guanosine(37)-N1)-methyltransferase TrmD [Bacillota bacterium]
MQISIVTIFPVMFDGVLGESILKRAREKELVKYRVLDLRSFSDDKHKSVDDYPYGGGPGMVMKAAPFFEAVEYLRREVAEPSYVVLTSPGGTPFNQGKVRELATKKHLIILCGRYEGVDERVRAHLADEDISIGDYILTGGEIPAMVIVDAVTRLIPGVLPEETTAEESFSQGLLEYPQYTRPRNFRGYEVPEVLLSGDHGRIEQWRREEALKRTRKKRPDLLREE